MKTATFSLILASLAMLATALLVASANAGSPSASDPPEKMEKTLSAAPTEHVGMGANQPLQ